MEGSSLNQHLKQKLRADFRQRRRSLDPATRQDSESQINEALLKLVAQRQVKRLSAYLAFDGEVDIRPALQQLSSQGVIISLPLISGPASAKILEFQCWRPGASLVKNAFGIDEPECSELIDVHQLDLVLLPLVAWDEEGRRLGMGAGYYDKALAPLSGKTKPQRIGIAFDLQKSVEIPAEPWDIPVHGVITENGLFTCPA